MARVLQNRKEKKKEKDLQSNLRNESVIIKGTRSARKTAKAKMGSNQTLVEACEIISHPAAKNPRDTGSSDAV